MGAGAGMLLHRWPQFVCVGRHWVWAGMPGCDRLVLLPQLLALQGAAALRCPQD